MPRRRQDWYQDFVSFRIDYGQLTATGHVNGFVCSKVFQVDRVTLFDVTGLAIDTSNYFVVALKNVTAGKVMASVSTHDVAIAADPSYTDLTLTTTTADQKTAAGDVLGFLATLTGIRTLPVGFMVVQGRYL